MRRLGMLSVKVNNGIAQSDSGLRKFADTVEDLTPFWRELGRGLAETIDARWPSGGARADSGGR